MIDEKTTSGLTSDTPAQRAAEVSAPVSKNLLSPVNAPVFTLGRASGGSGLAPAPAVAETSDVSRETSLPFTNVSENKSAASPSAFARGDVNSGRPWSSTPEGRAAIRLFSRGVMGAAFFALGQMKGIEDLQGYNANRPDGALQHIAAFIDKTFGRAIQGGAAAIAGALGADDPAAWGRRAVAFRPTRARGPRSLGEEAVAITFDFAAASVGDALGRNIADMFDPNIKKPWLKDGKVDLKEMAKAMGKSLWTIFSLNQGEDWAVAIPYAYFLRLQRNILNRIPGFKGFGFDSDLAVNGGSVRVDDQGAITGNYQLAGMLDLQGRFVAYNMLTSMYRDIYRKTQKLFDSHLHPEKYTEEFAAAQQEPQRTLAERVMDAPADTIRWAMRHIVKAGIYMSFAVPFFWVTRTPQSKAIGLAIHPEHGPMGTVKDGVFTPTRFGSELGMKKENQVFQRLQGVNSEQNPFLENGVARDPFNINASAADAWAAPVGRLNQKAVEGVQNVLAKSSGTSGMLGWVAGRMGGKFGAKPFDVNNFAERYVRAAASYTPYMYAKAELNTGAGGYGDNNTQMDFAVDRMTNGMFGLNWSEVKEGAKEVWTTFRRRPLSDPMRAGELAQLQKKNPQDTSPKPKDNGKPYAEIDHDPLLAYRANPPVNEGLAPMPGPFDIPSSDAPISKGFRDRVQQEKTTAAKGEMLDYSWKSALKNIPVTHAEKEIERAQNAPSTQVMQ